MEINTYTAFTTYEEFLKEYPSRVNDLEWLSIALMNLASVLYQHNISIATAELGEENAKLLCLDNSITDGKKVSVAEAESRAVHDTDNRYGMLKLEGQAIEEMCNAIKKRIEVIEFEQQNAMPKGGLKNVSEMQ